MTILLLTWILKHKNPELILLPWIRQNSRHHVIGLKCQNNQIHHPTHLYYFSSTGSIMFAAKQIVIIIHSWTFPSNSEVEILFTTHLNPHFKMKFLVLLIRQQQRSCTINGLLQKHKFKHHQLICNSQCWNTNSLSYIICIIYNLYCCSRAGNIRLLITNCENPKPLTQCCIVSLNHTILHCRQIELQIIKSLTHNFKILPQKRSSATVFSQNPSNIDWSTTKFTLQYCIGSYFFWSLSLHNIDYCWFDYHPHTLWIAITRD
jgi:hypothetical protein